MKRGGFKRPEPKPAKVLDSYTPRPRAIACARDDGDARMVVAVPKFAYVRDERYRDACRAMACQHCGASGDRAGVTWAHSNWAEHGKGKGIKASDPYVAALCDDCHRWLDQGSGSAAVKRAMWDAAHARTVEQGQRDGTWPQQENT